MVSILPAALFPICLVWAALTDIHRYIIPNSISLILAAGFGVTFAMSGLGFEVFLDSVMVAAAVFAGGFALWCLRVCGAGDVKLLSAAALWIGSAQIVPALLYIALMGGAVAIGVLVVHRLLNWFPGVTQHSKGLSRFAAQKKPDAPYGVAIAIGALIAFPETALFSALLG